MKIYLPRQKLPRVTMARITFGDDGSEHEEPDHKHKHHQAMKEVADRMEDHPKTWDAYIDQPGGMMSIVEMEYSELMEKKADGSRAGIEKELTDLAAACICALNKMKTM